MKLTRTSIDTECSQWAKRGLKIALPVLAVAATSIALGAPPVTFMPNQTLTASDLNANFTYLNGRTHDASGFRATLSNATSVNGGYVPIAFNQVSFDLSNEYNLQTGTFTPKQDGEYLLECGLFFAGAPSDLYTVAIAGVPASTEFAASAAPSTATGFTVSTQAVVKLSAGTAVQCGGYDGGSTAPLHVAQQDRVYFGAMRLN